MSTSLRIKRPKKSLRELAQDAVREAILDFRFAPGERLVERTLCDQLGVSRTVVREVLRYLEAEGLVEVTPNRGPIVAQIKPEDAEQIYELRSMLECVAARACAEAARPADLLILEEAVGELWTALQAQDPRISLKATGKFYKHMFRIAGKRIAWEMVESLNVRINALRALTIASPERRSAAAAEMQKLFDVIASGDADAAEAACAEHIESAARVAREVLKRSEADDGFIVSRLQSFTAKVRNPIPAAPTTGDQP